MTDKAIRSKWGIPEDETLAQALARSRVAPDYTMGAVSKQTGVPADTIRSWERRYGFPVPHRTDSNRRQYSERDIIAVAWLRDQSAAGQGISEAISMLLANLPGDVDAASPAPESIPASPVNAPFEALLDSFQQGRLSVAQTQWDTIVISLSPDAVGQLILDSSHHLAKPESSFSQQRARAFLLRKAQVLLDVAVPDQGHRSFCLLIPGTTQTRIQATVLAATIARRGHLVITPFLDATSLTTIDTIQQIDPDGTIILGTPELPSAPFQKLLPGMPMLHWQLDGGLEAVHSFLESIQPPHRDREP